MSKGRVVGEYQVGRQIGSGSFSVVWHGRHRVHGTEVAIKEIATARLNKKLQDSLMSEILILQKINHANIIKLHDIIEVPGKIHLVLEYCKGGDLSIYIQHHVRVPEDTAKHFMKQLAAGLKILRENNLIHRDLKPQNLLLSTTDSKSVLKIADFGFARSLQPRGLAETLCGSPLYMAPEIMQLQKYDAKADLWSVGAILFQLVVGKTPFSGNNQIQLLQNIIRSVELHFPPEITTRISAECKDLCRKLLRRNPVERLTFEEFFNHAFLEGDTITARRMNVGGSSKEISFRGRRSRPPQDDPMLLFLDDDFSISPEIIPPVSPLKSKSHRGQPEQAVVDSLELEDYVFVSGSPSTVMSSSSSKPALSLSPARASFPMQMIGFPTAGGISHPPLESASSAATDHPPGNHAVRITSLCQYASAIRDLVGQKVETGKQLEAFSMQLVNLAVWKQALHICHTSQAALGGGNSHQCSADIQEEFLREVDRAEELSSTLRGQATDVEMPDAIATIYQSALAFGRHGAVDELMGNTENAQRMYSKAVELLHFLLMEAPTLILNPPFSLTNADRYRLRTYIEAISVRCATRGE